MRALQKPILMMNSALEIAGRCATLWRRLDWTTQWGMMVQLREKPSGFGRRDSIFRKLRNLHHIWWPKDHGGNSGDIERPTNKDRLWERSEPQSYQSGGADAVKIAVLRKGHGSLVWTLALLTSGRSVSIPKKVLRYCPEVCIFNVDTFTLFNGVAKCKLKFKSGATA